MVKVRRAGIFLQMASIAINQANKSTPNTEYPDVESNDAIYDGFIELYIRKLIK